VTFSHVLGVDDAPCPRAHRGDVLVVATAYSVATRGLATPRLEGVLSTRVRRDGANATEALAAMVERSQFHDHAHALLLQGIALAGFNVVDIHALHDALDLAVLVVARRLPDLEAIRRALLTRVPGGRRKWALIERAGPMEPAGGVFVQRAGLSLPDAGALCARLAVCGRIPEPLRAAHLIAGGVTTGRSRGRT